MEISDLVQPCPICTEIRELYDRAWDLVCRVSEPGVPADGSRLQCRRCKGRGEELTHTGQVLARLVKQWCEDGKELPF
jgi:hypothetical protein